MTPNNYDDRIESIIAVVLEIAKGNFSVKTERSEIDDIVDALAIAVNMLAEELRYRDEGTNKLDTEKIESVARFIEQHFSEPYTLSDLAYNAGLSETKLKQGFKKVYGITLHKYYLKLLIEKVKTMLLDDPKVTIKDIAQAMGYSLPGMINLFKRETGSTPDAFRKYHANTSTNES